MKTKAKIRIANPADLRLAVHVNPGDTYEWSNVLLARASADGGLELLTAAWERVLGYSRHEFTGKTLRQLMEPAEPAVAVAAILDLDNMDPVELTLRCRNGKAMDLRLHRRFDDNEHKMFIVAEETSVRERADATVYSR
jgi:PAS domain-containing protein